MSRAKKQVRAAFRRAVFDRDGWRCALCPRRDGLDAHHVTPRRDMPNGGYVPENGVALCPDHHGLAELYLLTGLGPDEVRPAALYRRAGSSFEAAWDASLALVS